MYLTRVINVDDLSRYFSFTVTPKLAADGRRRQRVLTPCKIFDKDLKCTTKLNIIYRPHDIILYIYFGCIGAPIGYTTTHHDDVS